MPTNGTLLKTGLGTFNPDGITNIVRKDLKCYIKGNKSESSVGAEIVPNSNFENRFDGSDILAGAGNFTNTADTTLDTFKTDELVTNGNFDTDLSGWTIENSDSTHTVTYSNGSARYQSDTESPQLNFDQVITEAVQNKLYKISIDITVTTGSVKLVSFETDMAEELTDGLNVIYAVAASSKTIRIVRSSTNTDVLINSVSVKEESAEWRVTVNDISHTTLQVVNGALRLTTTSSTGTIKYGEETGSVGNIFYGKYPGTQSQYCIKYEVTANNGCTTLSFYDGSAFINKLPVTIGKHEITFSYNSVNNKSFRIKNNTTNSSIDLNNIEVYNANSGFVFFGNFDADNHVLMIDNQLHLTNTDDGVGVAIRDAVINSRRYNVLINCESISASDIAKVDLIDTTNNISAGSNTFSDVLANVELSSYNIDTTTDLITNGTFSADSNWIKTENESQTVAGTFSTVTINNSSSGVAELTIVNSAYAKISQTLTFTPGKVYKITATINGTNAKRIRFRDDTGNDGGLTTTNGVVTMTGSSQNVEFYFIANTNSNAVNVERHDAGNYSFTVDNVSLFEGDGGMSNLITNGDFSNGLTGWAKSSSAESGDSSVTVAVNDSNQLVLTSANLSGNLDYAIAVHQFNTPLVAGKTYKFKFDLISASPSSILTTADRVRIGTLKSANASSGYKNISQLGVIGAGTNQVFYFSPSQNDTHIAIGGRDDMTEMIIDNVSLEEVKPQISLANTGSGNLVLNSFSVKEKRNSVREYARANIDLTNGVTGNVALSRSGKLESGGCLSFSGGDSKVEIGDLGISAATIAFWININDITSNTEYIALLNTGPQNIQIVNGTVTPTNDGTPTVYVDGEAGSSVLEKQWHRVVITYASARTINNLILGYNSLTGNDALYGEFKMADFQIYNTAWSSSDVSYDFENPEKDVFTNPSSSIVHANCKIIFRLNELAGGRIYNAINAKNILTGNNVTFDGANDWTSYVGGSISTTDGVLEVTLDGSGHGAQFEMSSFIAAGKTYRVEADVWLGTATENGGFRIYLGGRQTVITLSSNRTRFTADFTTTNTSALLIYNNRLNSGTFNIDNVSVIEQSFVTTGHLLNGSAAFLGPSILDNGQHTNQSYVPQFAMVNYSNKMIFGGNGSGDYVNCGSLSDYTGSLFSGGATLSVWFSIFEDGGSNVGYLFSKGGVQAHVTTETTTSIKIKFTQIYSGDNGVWITDADTILKNQFNHFAITYDNSSVSNNPSFYLNGNLITANETTTPTGTANTDTGNSLIIGNADAGSTDAYFSGILDEFGIFKEELTASQIDEIYNSGGPLDLRTHSKFLKDTELSDSSWTANSPHAISGTTITLNSSSDASVTKDVLTDAKPFKMSLNLDTYTQGTIQLSLGSSLKSENVGGLDTFSFMGKCVGSTDAAIFTTGAAATLDTSNISIKEINMLGYWRNNGDSSWHDLSMNGNPGTAIGSPSLIRLQEDAFLSNKDVYGAPMNYNRHKSFSFNNHEFYNFGYNFNTFLKDTHTHEMWIKPNDGRTATAQYIFGNNPDANNKYQIYIDGSSSGKLKFDLRLAGGTAVTRISNDVLFSDGGDVWYHLVFVVTRVSSNSIDLKIYVNGGSVQTFDNSSNIADDLSNLIDDDTNPMCLGGTNFTNDTVFEGGQFNGLIDDYRLYARALTQAEANRNYNATKRHHVIEENRHTLQPASGQTLSNNVYTSVWSDDAKIK